MTRDQVTQLILSSKRRKRLKWSQLAEIIGHSKEWSTAALMGQMTLTSEQATKVSALLELPDEAVEMLQVVPYKDRCRRPSPPIRSSTASMSW